MDIQTNPSTDASSEMPIHNSPAASEAPVAARQGNEEFIPPEPKSLKDAGLHQNDLFPLVLKFLFLHGNNSGARIAHQVKVPFSLLRPVLDTLKLDLLIGAKQSSRIHLSRSTYCGSAPVGLNEYCNAVMRQSIKNLNPSFEDVANALGDLEVTDLQISQLGQAINSGKSMFLFGAPGNGKTSIAKRAIYALVKSFGCLIQASTRQCRSRRLPVSPMSVDSTNAGFELSDRRS